MRTTAAHDNYAEYMQTFEGGNLYSLGCHLVDVVDPMETGEPTKVTRVHKLTLKMADDMV